jgi:hypothetical protein
MKWQMSGEFLQRRVLQSEGNHALALLSTTCLLGTVLDSQEGSIAPNGNSVSVPGKYDPIYEKCNVVLASLIQ